VNHRVPVRVSVHGFRNHGASPTNHGAVVPGAALRAEKDMWIRGVIGVVLVAIGGVWIAQGSGAMHGGMMSGHSQYAALGAVVVVVGLALIGWALRIRSQGGRTTSSHRSRR
jgi:hypothetical protein